jgi:hypothetical protein
VATKEIYRLNENRKQLIEQKWWLTGKGWWHTEVKCWLINKQWWLIEELC